MLAAIPSERRGGAEASGAPREVVVRFKDAAAGDVRIAGDFNGWVPDRGVRSLIASEGQTRVWTKVLDPRARNLPIPLRRRRRMAGGSGESAIGAGSDGPAQLDPPRALTRARRVRRRSPSPASMHDQQGPRGSRELPVPRDLSDVLHYFLPELERTPDSSSGFTSGAGRRGVARPTARTSRDRLGRSDPVDRSPGRDRRSRSAPPGAVVQRGHRAAALGALRPDR